MNRSTAFLFIVPTILAGMALFFSLIESAETTPGEDFSGSSSPDMVGLQQRLDSLATEVRSLRHELEVLQALPPVSVAPSAAAQTPSTLAVPEESSNLLSRAEAVAAKTESKPAASVEPETLPAVTAAQKESVRLALDEIRAEDRQRDELRRRQREEAQIRRRIEELSGKLSLAPSQSEGMVRILLEESTVRRTLMEARRQDEGDMWASPNPEADWSAMREQMTKIRQKRDDDLSRILSASQFTDFQKEDQDRRGGFDRAMGMGRRGGDNQQRGDRADR